MTLDPPPDGFYWARPLGGFYAHLVPTTCLTARCGFTPSSRMRKQGRIPTFERFGWWGIDGRCVGACPHCVAPRAKDEPPRP